MMHDKKLVRMILDHLAGEPEQIEAIMRHRRCGRARAHQIVNELIYYALNHVPTQSDRNYHLKRHPNLVAYFVRVKQEGRFGLENTPRGFFESEIDNQREWAINPTIRKSKYWVEVFRDPEL